MHIEEAFRMLQDKSIDAQTIQQVMNYLIEVFIDALQAKPKILRDFSRIVEQGRQKLGEGYLLVDIGPMYVVQLDDLTFTPVLNKDAEKGSLDVIWMNQKLTEKIFTEEGKNMRAKFTNIHEKRWRQQIFTLRVFEV